MTSSSSTVLAIGAAGKFAGMVIPELVKRGVHVRALIHDDNKERQVRHFGAAEVVVGDLGDRVAMDKALRDMNRVFYIAPAFLPQEAEIGRGVVAAAAQAGVRRIVFSSVIHPILGALQNHAAKAPVEEAILTSGMEYTFLHPALFFQNLSPNWPSIVETGVLAEPWSVDSRFSRVDYRDVAEVAAIALTEDRLLYGTFELCAEGHFDRNDIAAIIAGVLDRPIKANRIDAQIAAADAGPAAHSIEEMFGWYDKRGLLGSALTLRVILGREPRTLRSFFAELKAASQAQSNIGLTDKTG
jgi:uncharacterized protein YbjT (DUF2867 family)